MCPSLSLFFLSSLPSLFTQALSSGLGPLHFTWSHSSHFVSGSLILQEFQGLTCLSHSLVFMFSFLSLCPIVCLFPSPSDCCLFCLCVSILFPGLHSRAVFECFSIFDYTYCNILLFYLSVSDHVFSYASSLSLTSLIKCGQQYTIKISV